MSSTDESFGLTDDDREQLTRILKQNSTKGNPRDHPIERGDESRPNLPRIDGEPHVVELEGNRETKVHREKADEELTPWCKGRPHGFDAGSSVRKLKYRPLSVARDWRDPCKVCFPEGFDE